MSFLSFVYNAVEVMVPVLMSDFFLVFSCMALLVAIVCIIVRLSHEFIRSS